MANFESILEFLKAPEDQGHLRVTGLQNPDLVPLRQQRRNWNWWGFLSYWVIHTLPISSYTSASTLLNYGLNVGCTMAAVIVGNALTTVNSILCGQPGADHHVSYSMYSKAFFGTNGFYLATLLRAISAIVWYGNNGWLGGLVINSLLGSLSYRYLTWENTLPASVPFTNREIIGFVIYQILLIPFMIYKPENMRIAMAVTSLMGFVAMIGICAFSVTNNNGSAGAMMTEKSALTGSAFSWAFFRALSQWYGSNCAGIINKPDFSRFASSKYVFIPGSIFAIMVIGTIVPLLGIISASAAQSKYGEAIWEPNELLDRWLLEYWGPKCRAGCFFASLFLVAAQVIFSGVCNCWSFGMDFAAVAPKWVNMRRATVFAALLCWVVQPWTMYNTSTNYGTVMSGFTVFFSPIIAIMACDYWLVRKRRLVLTSFFTRSTDGAYYGYKGFNLPGYIAFVTAMTPALPGLISAANGHMTLATGITHYYYGNAIFSSCVAFFLYWALSQVFKPNRLGEMDEADYYGTYSDADCKYWNVIPQRDIPKEELSKYVNTQALEFEDEVSIMHSGSSTSTDNSPVKGKDTAVVEVKEV